MKPKELKQPTACCGSPTLLWDAKKFRFTCPCGKTSTSIEGYPFKRVRPRM